MSQGQAFSDIETNRSCHPTRSTATSRVVSPFAILVGPAGPRAAVRQRLQSILDSLPS